MPATEQSLDKTRAVNGWFKTTHWSVLQDASGGDPAQAGAALATLCQAYWYPLYTYVRRLGHGPEDAKDLVQGFFAKLLEKEYIKSADREKGRFRTFLLTALQHYMAHEWNRANRQKRGGGRELLSLDAQDTENRYRSEPMENMTPERAFERRWALTLLEKIRDQLKEDYTATGKAAVFEQLEGCLSGASDGRTYFEIGDKLAMTEGAVKVAVHRLRRRYRELLRLEIANTVAGEEAVNDEIRHLFAALEAE